MKKSMKALIASVLCLMLVFSMAVGVFADDGGKNISSLHDAYRLVCGTELVAVYNATLNESGKDPQSVYYVVCKGLDFTEFDPTQPRSYASAVLIGLSNENNAYVKELKRIVMNNIPKNANIVIVGHSMGGMVLQQLIARSDIKRDYNILYSLSIGSPYILTLGTKEGTLRRCVDRLDPVAYLSLSLLTDPYKGNVSVETSYCSLVHFRSYDAACWDAYDCLGVKNGSASITLGDKVYGG